MNLDQINKQEHIQSLFISSDPLEFLGSSDLIKVAQKHSEIFTKLLIERPLLLHALIDIALRPLHYSKSLHRQLTPYQTHRAYQVLAGQESDLFIEYLFKNCHSSLASLSKEKNIDCLFSIIQVNDKIEETPTTYLCNLITPIFYKRPKDLVVHLSSNTQILTNMCKHLYCRSISQILILFLEANEEDEFFTDTKVQILKAAVKGIENIHPHDQLQALENLNTVLSVLASKLEEKYQAKRYLCVWKQFIAEANFKIVLALSPNSLEALTFIRLILGVDSRLQSNQNLRQQNLHVEQKLIEYFLGYISSGLELLVNSGLRMKIIQLFKILHILQTLQPIQSQQIIGHHFVNKILDYIVQYPHATILHAVVSNVLINHIRITHSSNIFFREDVGFVKLAQTLRKGNEINSLGIYIFRVLEAAMKEADIQEEQIANQFENILKEKTRFLSMKICNNQQDRKDSIWGSSECDQVITNLNMGGDKNKLTSSVNLDENPKERRYSGSQCHKTQQMDIEEKKEITPNNIDKDKKQQTEVDKHNEIDKEEKIQTEDKPQTELKMQVSPDKNTRDLQAIGNQQ